MSEAEQRVVVGWFVRRTYKTEPHRGKTMMATSRRIYPTREDADEAMRREAGYDDRFALDVCEAWMHADTQPRSAKGEGE